MDLKRGHLTVEDSKNGEKRGVRLVAPAVAELRERSKVRALDDDRVFRDAKSVGWAFGRALKKAKILDFKVHDLRHTAASYLAMNGASPSEIAAVLGHKTLAMVKRYSHLPDAHVAGVVDRMAEKFLADIGGAK
ncbi:MAG: site-specific integrase [Myxococcota bacterium]